VDVSVEHLSGMKFCCPECAELLPCYDHTAEHQWRHLDRCQFKTILHARIPRVECPTHGVKQVALPWAKKASRFTLMFERFAIQVLLTTKNVKGTISILRTKWDQTWSIVERAVARRQVRKQDVALPQVGIDDKAFLKGQKYITLVYDLNHSTVEAISDGNDAEAGFTALSELSEAQHQSIEAIAMDISPAYVRAAQQAIPWQKPGSFTTDFILCRWQRKPSTKSDVRNIANSSKRVTTEGNRILFSGETGQGALEYVC
jgi:transposase